jgi:hypothetical protein
MAYKVDKFNGNLLTTVADGTLDASTDLRFVGKNYAGYGEIQNENFLHLMENFANTTPPPKPVVGQIWYDTNNKKLRFYDGTRFKLTTGAEVGTQQPSGLGAGELWWNSSVGKLYIYNGTDFTLVGPDTDPQTGGAVARVVKDSLGGNRTILQLLSEGSVVAIVSSTAFTLGTENLISGFSQIKQGFTLINTGTDGVTTSDHTYWGTASNALRLGGFPASDYLRGSDLLFSATARFSDNGFTVGDGDDIAVKIRDGDKPYIESRLGVPIKVEIRNPDNLFAAARNVLTVSYTDVYPGESGVNLGTPSLKWNAVNATTVNATTVNGNLVGNSAGDHTGNVRAINNDILINAVTREIGSATTTFIAQEFIGPLTGDCSGKSNNSGLLEGAPPRVIVEANSIVQRDSSGDVFARNFVATGAANKADALRLGDTGTYVFSNTGAIGNTIAARTSGGNLFAILFEGTATSARYADLAEKYLTDRDYDVGTVVAVGGEKEVTASQFGDRAIGVVSANPAFMMNSELEGGTYVALKGRVPVKVVGSVKKKDRLVATDNGCAIRATHHQHSDVFAIALEDSDDTGVKLIEAIIL